MDPVSTPYSDSLQALYDASGGVQTQINSNGGNAPTQAQSDFLNYLQGEFTNKLKAAAADPDLPTMPIPGTLP